MCTDIFSCCAQKAYLTTIWEATASHIFSKSSRNEGVYPNQNESSFFSTYVMIRCCSCRVVAIKRSRQLQTRDGLLRFTVKHSDIFRHHPLDLALLQPDCTSRIATFIFILLKDTSLIMSHPNGKDSNQHSFGLLTELPFWPFLCWSFEVFL